MFSFEKILLKVPEKIKDYLSRCEQALQNPFWHPEGNTLIHIKIVYNRALKTSDINLILTALFHDLGKADTTKLNNKGNWSAHGHEFVSAKLVEEHKDWIEEMGGDWEMIHWLVKEHMRIKHFDEMRPHKRKELEDNIWFDKLSTFTSFDDMTTLSDEEINKVS